MRPQNHGLGERFLVDCLVASILSCLIQVTSKASLRLTRMFAWYSSMLLIRSQERQDTSQASTAIAGLILEKFFPWSVRTGKRRSSDRLWSYVRLRN